VSDDGVNRVEESLPVQLTRMEGVLNLIAERGQNTDRRVDVHAGEIVVIRGEITGLQSLTQTLKEGAEADKKTAVALALALKEAEETRRTKTESAWSPFTKLFAVITAGAVLWSIFSPLFMP
jgi:hypothetical protein